MMDTDLILFAHYDGFELWWNSDLKKYEALVPSGSSDPELAWHVGHGSTPSEAVAALKSKVEKS